VVPAAAVVGAFVVVPAALGLLSTFTSYNPFATLWHLVGLANYRAILSDKSLESAFGNALLMAALAVPFELALGLGLALALRKPFPGRSLVRVLLLAPWLVSAMAAGVMWHFLFDSQVGITGWVAAWLGKNSSSPLADPHWALVSVAAVDAWRMMPLAAFLLLPGVLAVPQDELDYATLVGSPPWTTLRVVILPHLRVLLLTVLLLLVGEALTVFDSILVLTGGGPGSHTMTPALGIRPHRSRIQQYGVQFYEQTD
jgi:multiple sugar transport system permease protein